ncbi:uncharacterized protein LOC135165724 isoform X2 [Diachasmimorpha longicaudata]|uniref:uncharacterized protein LOC135165724 isoform X2 n=1 Tax=Diachasmimorpha longicaudata TaxID=58733 RepID=UPI0030B8CE25
MDCSSDIIRIWFWFALVVVLLELVQLPEARKYMRPWKFHGSKSRWHELSRGPRYRFKRRPPKYHRSKWYSSRYASQYLADEEPYTIEIELPKHRRRANHLHSKMWDKRHRDYDDDDEDHDKSDLISEKRIRVKWIKGENPKLRIKISRNDSPSDLGVIDMRNVTPDAGYHSEHDFQAVTPTYAVNGWAKLPARGFRDI